MGFLGLQIYHQTFNLSFIHITKASLRFAYIYFRLHDQCCIAESTQPLSKRLLRCTKCSCVDQLIILYFVWTTTLGCFQNTTKICVSDRKTKWKFQGQVTFILNNDRLLQQYRVTTVRQYLVSCSRYCRSTTSCYDNIMKNSGASWKVIRT